MKLIECEIADWFTFHHVIILSVAHHTAAHCPV